MTPPRKGGARKPRSSQSTPARRRRTTKAREPLVSVVPSRQEPYVPPPMESGPISAAMPVLPSRDVPAAAVRDTAEPIDVRVLIGVDIGCLVVTAALAVVVLLGAAGPARLLLALAFTSVVPGWALVRRLGLAGTATGAAMAVPSSLAIIAAGSVAMVWAHAWQPLILLWVLAAVSAGVIGWMLRIEVGSLTRTAPALGR